jgi:predicted AAA+ superfamily ATPase
MAGRAAVFHLAPLSFGEVGSWNLLRGGFPEVVLRPRSAGVWFASYIQTYLERDVRSLKAIKDLSTFRRFLSLVASRHGQILNRSGIAAPLGISVPTVSEWLGVLEATGQIVLIPPYYENFGKRLIKSPKLYWMDSGLVCHLLGIETEKQLERSPFMGPVFEGFMASEMLKNQANQGRRRELYFFRDEQGLEIDFLAPGPRGGVMLIEAKWSKTLRPSMAEPLRKLARAVRGRPVVSTVVHRAPRSGPKLSTLAPGVKAMTVEDFLDRFPGQF